MKKVLLISANRMRKPYPVYPLGLDYVAGALQPRYQTNILDMNYCPSLDALGEQVREYAPDYVGLSIRNIDNTDSMHSQGFLSDYIDMVGQIRQHSKAPLILGGSGYTVFPLNFSGRWARISASPERGRGSLCCSMRWNRGVTLRLSRG